MSAAASGSPASGLSGTEPRGTCTNLPSRRSIGVIDVGSNSLRLVVYESNGRAPRILFNEKVMCALGRGMDVTGRLNPEGVVLARANMERFVALARHLSVERLDVLATSAVRDALDGPGFVAEIEARHGIRVDVIPGEEEGRLSAAGVLAGIPEADGLMADLGGGSVELAPTRPASAEDDVVSLPIGPLRLLGGTAIEAQTEIDRAIAGVPWLARGRGRPFYAVGGAWRTLARMHMDQVGYPLHIIHEYTLPRLEAENFLSLIGRQSGRSLGKVAGVSRKRLETLPLAAYILLKLLRVIRPSTLIFSAYGLREGHLFRQLQPAERALDPLLVGAEAVSSGTGRFGGVDKRLGQWLAPLFRDSPPEEARLRQAATLLSDIGWNEHPDYRDEHAFLHCLRMPLPGLDHPGRVFIATALHARYGGAADEPAGPKVQGLLDPAAYARARALGLAIRLAYTVAGGVMCLLERTRLGLDPDGDVVLAMQGDAALFTGEAVARRLDALGRQLGRPTAIRQEG